MNPIFIVFKLIKKNKETKQNKKRLKAHWHGNETFERGKFVMFSTDHLFVILHRRFTIIAVIVPFSMIALSLRLME